MTTELQAAGSEGGELLQRGANEGQIGIDPGAAQHQTVGRQAGLREYAFVQRHIVLLK